jgi:hypothetical protein
MPRRPYSRPVSLALFQSHCGSEPAREEVSAFGIFINCGTAIASKLAPTGVLCRLQNSD